MRLLLNSVPKIISLILDNIINPGTNEITRKEFVCFVPILVYLVLDPMVEIMGFHPPAALALRYAREIIYQNINSSKPKRNRT